MMISFGEAIDDRKNIRKLTCLFFRRFPQKYSVDPDPMRIAVESLS